MTDIPKMLRSEALIADEDWTGLYGISPNLAFAAADRIEKLETALREVAKINNARDRFSSDIDAIIINALGEQNDDA